LLSAKSVSALVTSHDFLLYEQ